MKKAVRSPRKATAKKAARPRTKPAPKTSGVVDASELITARIMELGDWRGEVLHQVRTLLLASDPGIVEEWKWGLPVWSHTGILCTGETYKRAVKLTFAKGAFLRDPAKLFNSSLEGNLRRAIDIHEGDEIRASAFQDLIRAAVALNMSGKKKSLA